MASRRNELSAYTFSRRRTVAAFLQPSGGGNEEDVPKPLRAVLPSIVVGALAVAGFGAYGIFKPSAPLHWQSANAVIVDKQTTTRYVMLDNALHPVLNIASARLLLQADSSVEEVDDSVLNSGSVAHGATIGIPYAPDSLPTAKDAATAKAWADCDRPTAGGQGGTDQKLFVLGGADAKKVSGAGRVDPRHALYVQAPDGTYLVDATGIAHRLAGAGSDTGATGSGSPGGTDSSQLLAIAAFGPTVGAPQVVTKEWLATLRQGDPVTIPKDDIDGYGSPIGVGGVDRQVGDLLQVSDGGGQYLHYVVLKDGPHRVSDFTDRLLDAMHPSQAQEPTVAAYAVAGANSRSVFESGKDWPKQTVSPMDPAGGAASSVACSVYTGSASGTGVPVMGVWSGNGYPVVSASGSAGVYVTPGTGLLYRAVTGTSTNSGTVNLLTDTGLRYPVQINSDGGSTAGSTAAAPGAASTDPGTAASGQQPDNAQARLGYGGVSPVPVVPEAWSDLLPSGPVLDTSAARQAQGS